MSRAIILRAYGRPVNAPLAVRIGACVGGSRLQGLPPGPPGDLLDVGCGSGAFLLGLEEAGWTCSGVEIDAAAVETAHTAGLTRVRHGDLLDQEYGAGSFDVVRFWHSLEHTRSPRAQLAEARRVLRRGGTLMVGVPNFGSPLARWAREKWFNLDVPRHLWHFDRGTLSTLVASEDFRLTSVRTRSYGAALLGTFDYLRGTTERLVNSRKLWFAIQPVAWILDAAGQGDELELLAVAE
jgi:SAM-dependent methyltransferase